MVTDLRMRAPGAAIDGPIEHDPSTDAGAHRHVDEARHAPSGAGARLAERGAVGVVLDHDGHIEGGPQIAPLPPRQEIDLAVDAAPPIDRARGSDGHAIDRSEHRADSRDRAVEAVAWRGRLLASLDERARAVHERGRDLRAPDVDDAEHGRDRLMPGPSEQRETARYQLEYRPTPRDATNLCNAPRVAVFKGV
ncbi:MAG: hypothetical protein U0270_41785 [Labilithrix sp.]